MKKKETRIDANKPYFKPIMERSSVYEAHCPKCHAVVKNYRQSYCFKCEALLYWGKK